MTATTEASGTESLRSAVGLVNAGSLATAPPIHTAKSANALGQSILMNMPEKCDQKVCTNVVLVV